MNHQYLVDTVVKYQQTRHLFTQWLLIHKWKLSVSKILCRIFMKRYIFFETYYHPFVSSIYILCMLCMMIIHRILSLYFINLVFPYVYLYWVFLSHSLSLPICLSPSLIHFLPPNKHVFADTFLWKTTYTHTHINIINF